MPDNTQQALFESFENASGRYRRDTTGSTMVARSDEVLASALADASRKIDSLSSSSQSQTDVINANTQVLVSTASNQKATTQSNGDSQSVLSTVLKNAFGLMPLVSGIASLFGGGSQADTTPLVKTALPGSIDFRGTDLTAGIQAADYDQFGMPRSYGAMRFQPERYTVDRPQTPINTGGTTTPIPQITVNVQAIDSRSFLDHSQEIAHAVREAMLNMNPINDVVSDL